MSKAAKFPAMVTYKQTTKAVGETYKVAKSSAMVTYKPTTKAVVVMFKTTNKSEMASATFKLVPDRATFKAMFNLEAQIFRIFKSEAIRTFKQAEVHKPMSSSVLKPLTSKSEVDLKRTFKLEHLQLNPVKFNLEQLYQTDNRLHQMPSRLIANTQDF